MIEKLNMKKGNRTRTLFIFGNYVFLLFVIFIMLIPLLKVLSDSLDAKGLYGLSLIPSYFSVAAYKVVVTNSSLFKPFLISIYVTVIGTIIAMLMTTMAAYVLVQKEMPGRTFFVYMILFSMIFHAGMIPTYLQIKSLGLLNTLWAVILPLALSPFNIILMKNFFAEIPSRVHLQ